ncbi:MAG: SAM-dependent chlorinase/fluorinase [Nitrospirae bacterium]|nr:SAM-dependent chlorinase/fluorinase [Nitrospirota bacterium]MBI3394172.1 SAM-dependent chlorinase/fluorinase [Nitrospirota bacterium]
MDVKEKRLIALLSDFGHQDPFVGVIKGIILGINPLADFVDITHEIPPQDVEAASLALQDAEPFFPPKTIFLVVVDPGVGSSRRPILAVTDRSYFIAPDNGVLTGVMESSEWCQAYHVTAEHYFRPERSATFHGRDVFAPVTGWLSRGTAHTNFGEPIEDPVRLPQRAPKTIGKTILEGEVVRIDRFGNLGTNIKRNDIDRLAVDAGRPAVRVLAAGRAIERISAYYAEIPDGELGAIIDSDDRLEIFVNRGRAADTLGAKKGDTVGVVLPER